ncbi:LOW QUALITY PROTEIN: uncharacterized protein C12orf50 homolog [Cariama cristata]
MATAGNAWCFHSHSPDAQYLKTFLLQQYSIISCSWESQPIGCVRITCACHHSKPCHINGLFLPLSPGRQLEPGTEEESRAGDQDKFILNQENVLPPIHPPLIINLNNEEDEQNDDEEENCIPSWVPKTAADIEEERAIKEIQYKSGEYYGIQYPHEHPSRKSVSSPQENELLPLEATKQHLQKDKLFKKGSMCYFNSSETNYTELVKNHHCKEGKKKKCIFEPHVRPQVKPSYRQRGQRKDDETASSIPSVRETGRKTCFYSLEPQRSAYVVYCTATITQESKLNDLLTQGTNAMMCCVHVFSMDKRTSGSYNAPTGRRNPHAKTFSKFKTTTQVFLTGQSTCEQNGASTVWTDGLLKQTLIGLLMSLPAVKRSQGY